MSHRMTLCACLLGSGLFLATSQADEGGFNLSKLNPFAARSGSSPQEEEPLAEPPRDRFASRETIVAPPEQPEPSGFSWPSLPKPKWPSFSRGTKPPSRPPANTLIDDDLQSIPNDEPTAWEKINSGTREFFSKTKQTLMPWSSSDDSQSTRRRPARTSSRTKSKSDKKPFFSSFWSSEEEEQEVQTVSDYLALPRVPY